METFVLRVGGMSCHHCKMAVEMAAGAVAGVETAQVDLGKNQVTITGNAPDRAKIIAAIQELGYLVEK